jgi:macrodomain Ter protein organizer (MatP/YcbG family)
MGRVVSADPRKAPRWVRIHPLVYERLKEDAERRGLTLSELVRRVLERAEGIRALPPRSSAETHHWPRLALRIDRATWDRLRSAARVYHLTLTDALNLRLAHFLGVLEQYLLLRTGL